MFDTINCIRDWIFLLASFVTRHTYLPTYLPTYSIITWLYNSIELSFIRLAKNKYSSSQKSTIFNEAKHYLFVNFAVVYLMCNPITADAAYWNIISTQLRNTHTHIVTDWEQFSQFFGTQCHKQILA